MRYVSAEEAIAISAEVLGLDSATAVHSARVPLVESAAARPVAGFGEHECYADLPSKAAALMVGLARNHPFLDGNKRTALLGTLMFLDFNGCTLDLSNVDEALNEIVSVADGTIDIEELTGWLASRLSSAE